MDMKEIKRYDKNGNLIYYKDSIGFEEWWVYDNNNLIYHKDWSIEEWYEYDQNGNEIHYKDSNGFEEWRTYDHDDCIHFKNNKEEWIYNDNKIIHKQKHCSVEFINLTPDIINLLNKNNKLVFTIKPSPKDNTIYIVSDPIIKSYPNRNDLLTPVDPVVDSTGKIIGYRCLGRI